MNASRRLASIGSSTRSWPSMRDAAGGRPQNAGQRPQRRRLAGAVGTDQADDFAASDLERQVVDGGEGPAGVGAAEVLDGNGHDRVCYD